MQEPDPVMRKAAIEAAVSTLDLEGADEHTTVAWLEWLVPDPDEAEQLYACDLLEARLAELQQQLDARNSPTAPDWNTKCIAFALYAGGELGVEPKTVMCWLALAAPNARSADYEEAWERIQEREQASVH